MSLALGSIHVILCLVASDSVSHVGILNVSYEIWPLRRCFSMRCSDQFDSLVQNTASMGDVLFVLLFGTRLRGFFYLWMCRRLATFTKDTVSRDDFRSS